MMRIALDAAASTGVRPEVLDVMLPLLAAAHNPSAVHADGRAARAAVDDARVTVARALGAVPREIVFTGSGTESDVLAILGAARARPQRRHVVTSAIEHPAVAAAVEVLAADGWSVDRVGVSAAGVVDPAAVRAALRPDTALVSVMLGNNEIGTIQPVAAIAAAAHEVGALMHTDAVQAAGYLDLAVDGLGVDLLSLSAHKFGGPKGSGVLYVRRGTALVPQLVGGGQEHGLRSGTENVAGIAGLARALDLAVGERERAAPRVAGLRDRFEAQLLAAVPTALVLGADAPRLPHISAIAIAMVPADALLIGLDLEGVSASAGSACAAGSAEPSHVVAALDVPEAYALGMLRFSLHRDTTAAEIDRAAEVAARVIERSRASKQPV